MSRVTNMVMNPSAEGATLSLAAVTSASVAKVSDTATGAGASSYRVTGSAAGINTVALRTAERPAASPGQRWWGRVKVRLDPAVVGMRRVSAKVVFRNSTGTVLNAAAGGAAGGYDAYATVDLNPGDVANLIVTGVAPSTSVTADIVLSREVTYQPASGDIEYFDQVLLGPYDGVDAPAYGDGSTQGWAWTGTANASSSFRYDTAPQLTPIDDDAPCPRVQLIVAEFLPGTATVTMHRLTSDGDAVVPGVNRVSGLGGLIRYDYYAPFGVPVTYQAEMFDANGASLGYSIAGTVTLNVTDAVITSPTDPRKSVRVEMGAAAGSTLTNPVTAQVHEIDGRRILIAEADYGLDGVPLSFWTDTLQQYRAVLDVFRSANSLVVFRIPPPMEVPRTLYVFGVPTRTETNLPMGIEEFGWELQGTEVTPPTTQVVIALVTYARFRNYFPTYRAFLAAVGTYKNAQLNPPPEV